MIKHPFIKGISITGSPRAGSTVSSQAGSVLKKTVLELGGNDPYIILHDADLEQAVTACLSSRLNNAGQVCIAAKKIIIEQRVYQDCIDLFQKNISQYQMGDPLLAATDAWPTCAPGFT